RAAEKQRGSGGAACPTTSAGGGGGGGGGRGGDAIAAPSRSDSRERMESTASHTPFWRRYRVAGDADALVRRLKVPTSDGSRVPAVVKVVLLSPLRPAERPFSTHRTGRAKPVACGGTITVDMTA